MKFKLAVSLLFTLALFSYSNAGLSGLGLGIQGGLITGYDNPGLENSVLDQYTNFELKNNMTDIGAHLKIGTLRVIEFELNADYSWKKQNIDSTLNLTFSDFSITALVKKSVSLTSLKPYIAAGVGLHWLAYSLSLGEDVVGVYLPENKSSIGYRIKGGIELDFPVFPFTPFVEYQYNIISVSGDDIKYNSIIGGITLDLP